MHTMRVSLLVPHMHCTLQWTALWWTNETHPSMMHKNVAYFMLYHIKNDMFSVTLGWNIHGHAGRYRCTGVINTSPSVPASLTYFTSNNYVSIRLFTTTPVWKPVLRDNGWQVLKLCIINLILQLIPNIFADLLIAIAWWIIQYIYWRCVHKVFIKYTWLAQYMSLIVFHDKIANILQMAFQRHFL